MHPAVSVLFMLFFVLLCLLGILANGFIVLVLSREWRRRGRLLPSDMILLFLGASRFCLQWVSMVRNLYFFLNLGEYRRASVRQLFRFHWHLLNSATFWFGTWLSVLFCIKIMNFRHPTFLWLKWRFPGLVPWLLLGSLLISFIVGLLFFLRNHMAYQAYLMQKFSGNMTYQVWLRRLDVSYILPLRLITLSVPCSVFLVSIVLLIHSLRRHRQTMRHNAQTLQDTSTQAHTRALKSLVCFLVLYVLSFLSLMIDTAGFVSLESGWYWPWQILIYLYISVHPFILILSNPRLRGVFRQLLLLARGFWVT